MNTLEERFWSKVDKTPGHGPKGECWIWTGAKFRRGYGAFRIGHKQKRAHRVSLQLSGSAVPDDLQVCHTCDVASCVNPKHLFLGTNKDNVTDMVAKNRQTRVPGELHGAVKLTETQIEQVKQRKAKGDVQKHIAQDFGVSEALISRILNGKCRLYKTRSASRRAAAEKAAPCADCRRDTHKLDHWYMTTPELWQQCGAGAGYLCLPCLVLRAGRTLKPSDFPREIPINSMPWTIMALLPFIEIDAEFAEWTAPVVRSYADAIEREQITRREWFWRYLDAKRSA